MKHTVRELLVAGNVKPWTEVCECLNRKLRGWAAYFRQGMRAQAYRAVDEYVYDSVRTFLRRRHKVSSRGTRQILQRTGVWACGSRAASRPMSARSKACR
ncbi:MAG: group II intron maturase-specific domain-containing protein [Bryobacteraceae bacterium]